MTANSTVDNSDNEHAEILHMLPWYVKNSLSATENERVKQHLTSCEDCKKEWLRCQAIANNVPSETGGWQPSASHFSAILDRVEAYEAELTTPSTLLGAAKDNKPGFFDSIAGWFSQSPRPMQWAFALETAACLGLLLLVLVPQFQLHKDAGDYQTLSNPELPVSSNGVAIRLLFADDMTTKEINDLLKQFQGQVRQGPSAVGSYTVEIPKPNKGKALAVLHGHPKVKLAQVIDQTQAE